MLDRHDPSAVTCAHCNSARATAPCPGCSREVCDGCLANIASCTNPRSFELRLGIGARLRHVGRGATVGLVSTLTRRLWLLDLLGRTRLDRPPGYRWSRTMAEAGGLSSRGELLWPRVYSRQYTTQLRITSAGIDHREIYLDPAVATLRFDRSETAVIGPTVDERVLISPLDPGERPQVVTPLSRRVIQAFDADLGSGLIAAATHGELGAVRRREERPMPVAELQRTDSLWVGVAGERVAVLSGQRSSPLVQGDHRITMLEADGRELTRFYSATHRGAAAAQDPVVADISDDGRFVALALASREIAVHDVDGGGVQRLPGHTDRISALRFGPDAEYLVSGDFDNRVIVRFRVGGGFAENVEALEICDAK
jgi:hypothetical protein